MRSPLIRRPLVRRTATAGALILSLSVLSACGGDDENESADSADSAASPTAGESEAADDTTEETDAEPDAVAAGETIDNAEFIGLFQDAVAQASTASVSVNTGGVISVGGEGEVDFTTTPLSMQLSLDIPDAPGPLEFILVDGVIYQGQGQADGKFFAFDLDDPNSPFGSDFTEQLDPRAAFENFESGLQEVTFEGEEDGLSTYTIAVDSAALLEGIEGAQGAEGVLPDVVEYSMSIDDEGFFRTFSADLGEQAGTFEASYDNWGEDVDITAPAQRDIAELPGA